MSKTIYGLLLIFIVTTGLTGCGGGSFESGEPDPLIWDETNWSEADWD